MRSVPLAVIALAALATVGDSAVAQQSPAPAPIPEARPQGRPVLGRAEVDALTDARIAAIQAGLKLNAEQQALWPAVERAIREIAADRATRAEQRRAQASPQRQDVDFLGRLERRTGFASENAGNLTALTTALKPLWASLDERQKRLLPVLMRPTRSEIRWARADGREMRRERMMERRGGTEQTPPRP